MDDAERGPQGQPAKSTWQPTMTKGAEPELPTSGLVGRNESVVDAESAEYEFQRAASGEDRDSGVYNSASSAPNAEPTLPLPALPPEEE